MPLSEMYPIGEWLPDQPDNNAGGAVIVKNALTNGESYVPMQDLLEQSAPLSQDCLGAYSFLSPDGNADTFAASADKIRKLDAQSTSWADVTNVSDDYVTTAENVWHFTQFGKTVLATNYDDKIQKYTVGSDTEFSDLITSGPDVKCRNFGIVNNFLVGVDINDGDGVNPNRVRWSPFNNPDGDWTSSQSTQADYQNVEDGNPGPGMAVIGGQNYGTVIFRNAIYRMEYVGPPKIFEFHLVEKNRGAINGQSVASDGVLTFFPDENGFFLFDGVRSRPIGDKKVDRWFHDNLDVNALHKMRAVTHPTLKSFFLAFPSLQGNGSNDMILNYNWAADRFTPIEKPVQQLFRFLADGWDLEDVGNEYADLDTDVPFTLDSRFWRGGAASLGAFSMAQRLGIFDGANLTAEFESQEVRLNADGRTVLKSIVPVVEGIGTTEVRIGARDLLNANPTYTGWLLPSLITGQVDKMVDARYHRVGFKLSGEWEHFQGLRFDGEKAGVI